MALTQKQLESLNELCWGIYKRTFGAPFWESVADIVAPQQPAPEEDEALIENMVSSWFGSRRENGRREIPEHIDRMRKALELARRHFAQQEREAEAVWIEKYAQLDRANEIARREAVEQAVREPIRLLRNIIGTYVFLDSMTAGHEPQHSNTVSALGQIKDYLAAAVPAEKTPEERVTLHFVGGTEYMVKIDGKDRKGFETLEDAAIFRLGLIAQIAAQGGDHADTK